MDESELGSGPAGRMRKAGELPAIVYGLHRDSVAVIVGDVTSTVCSGRCAEPP